MLFSIPAAAQAPQQGRTPAPRTQATNPAVEPTTVVPFPMNADQTRRQLVLIMKQYPPNLDEVFKTDPSLLNNRDYLTLYPALNSFLSQHPEIAHNPSYFFGEAYYRERESDATQIWRNISESVAIVSVASLAVFLFTWLIRTAIDYRRWARVSRVQELVHSKLMDRLTSNEELLNYIQTPAGKRFLESAPISMDAAPQTISAPLSRILWSAQTGLVLAFGGLGLFYAFSHLQQDKGTEPIYVISLLAIALGIGFVVSAAVAYVFSQRLGLLSNVPTQTGREAPTQP
jgi:hypothetical protein